MIEVADAYAAAVHLSNDPFVISCYAALIQETLDYFRTITTLTIEPLTDCGQQYRDSSEMIADTERGHLYYLPTSAGYGPENSWDQVNGFNPMLAKTEFVDHSGNSLLVNDIFRIVHDVQGHAAGHFSFGPLGEFNAYVLQASQYSFEAKLALVTETLGQNAWVNFGPHLRRKDGTVPNRTDADYVAPQDRPFAEQKIAILPIEVFAALNEWIDKHLST